jgi:hypothetical protein
MIASIPQKPLCDFCSQPVGVTCFLSAQRAMEMINSDTGQKLTINSDEHWVSCPDCAELVRKRDRLGLANRSFSLAPPAIKGSRLTLEGILVTQAGLFWPNYNGLEHPLSEHPAEE